MNDKLMTDVGENYEYIRTIIDNKIEIAKISISITSAKIVGYIILAIFMLGLLGLIFASLVVALAIFLANLVNSLIGGILLSSLLTIILAILLFTFRVKLIFNPVANLFYDLIEDED